MNADWADFRRSEGGERLSAEFGFGAEVQNQSDLVTRGLQIVKQLRLMFRRDGLRGFDFNK
jgi:hypothetical protein